MDAAELLETIDGRSASLDRPIVVGISGYGGAGKSTLARRLVDLVPGSSRMHGDDFLDPSRSHRRSDDWDGVERDRLVSEVLLPFQERRASTFRRYDWSRRALGDPESVPVGEVLIVDVIGLFHPSVIDVLDLTVWCDVDVFVAQQRGIQRDARLGRDHPRLWHEIWTPNELDFDANFVPRAQASVLVPATGLLLEPA